MTAPAAATTTSFPSGIDLTAVLFAAGMAVALAGGAMALRRELKGG
jgi:hypothetical protein